MLGTKGVSAGRFVAFSPPCAAAHPNFPQDEADRLQELLKQKNLAAEKKEEIRRLKSSENRCVTRTLVLYSLTA
jgi:hypothetical protein